MRGTTSLLGALGMGAICFLMATPRESSAAAGLARGCERGEPASCTALGRLIDRGEAPGDLARAASLYWRGCGGGDMPGCAALGRAYLEGRGLEQDLERATSLLSRACQAGVSDGCRFLMEAPIGPSL